MTDCCENNCVVNPDAKYRKVLWVALVLNLTMFFVEITAGLKGNSVSLLADAIDFFGDSANYALSIFVLGMSVRTRAKASLFKASCMGLFGIYVMGSVLFSLLHDKIPEAHIMGSVGFLALITNVSVALLLFKYRDGDSNMQSVWLCSRNDAIGNIAVMLAAIGVFETNSNLPDLFVAVVMGMLGITASIRVLKKAREELKPLQTPE
jgi:Co/Zn/Cd efflux system component